MLRLDVEPLDVEKDKERAAALVGMGLSLRPLAPGQPIVPKLLDQDWDCLLGLTKRLDDNSQFGESTLVAAIFEKIGMLNQWCFECGAGEPEYSSNTYLFREQQWMSVLIEKDPEAVHLLRKRAGPWAIVLEEEAVDLDSILEGVRCPWCRARFPFRADLGIIDVDGQDWHLWNRLRVYRPRVMVVEVWAHGDDQPVPAEGGRGQAGENAIVQLGRQKGYKPICRTTCNVIFVDGNMNGQGHAT